MAESSSKMQGLAWFIAGLGVGALVGILYAPKSGKEIREELATGAREGTEFLRSKTREATEHVGEYVERGREVAGRGRAQWEEFVERGKNLVTDQTNRVSAAVDAGRQAYRAAAEPVEPAAPVEPAV
jgi:gas vesicle protein